MTWLTGRSPARRPSPFPCCDWCFASRSSPTPRPPTTGRSLPRAGPHRCRRPAPTCLTSCQCLVARRLPPWFPQRLPWLRAACETRTTQSPRQAAARATLQATPRPVWEPFRRCDGLPARGATPPVAPRPPHSPPPPSLPFRASPLQPQPRREGPHPLLRRWSGGVARLQCHSAPTALRQAARLRAAVPESCACLPPLQAWMTPILAVLTLKQRPLRRPRS